MRRDGVSVVLYFQKVASNLNKIDFFYVDSFIKSYYKIA